jgi:hypothetical protein
MVPNWVVAEYGKPKVVEAAPLSEEETAALAPILKALAAGPVSTHDLVVGLKEAFPELGERLDGDRVDSLCRQMAARGELKEA